MSIMFGLFSGTDCPMLPWVRLCWYHERVSQVFPIEETINAHFQCFNHKFLVPLTLAEQAVSLFRARNPV